MIDTDEARAILMKHGLAPAEVPVATQRLGGGVSSDVVLVTAGDQSFVLKRPLERFRVADEWQVPTRRVRVEFEVGWFLESTLGGESVIPILVFDEPSGTLVMETAPHGWRTWKERLLAGQTGPGAARAAGRLLARVHSLAEQLDEDTFRNAELFAAQRLDPYFRTSAAREPDVKDALEALGQTFAERSDFVHGDFSPKNLFTDAQMTQVRLIDHEVATRGDAAFDVAFCLTHLVLKAVHMPGRKRALHDAARLFLETYTNNRVDEAADPPYARERRAMAYLGGLVLARVVGKSPVEYLDAAARATARTLGLRLLADPVERLEAVLELAGPVDQGV